MHEWGLAVVAASILAYAALSRRFETWAVSPAMFMVAAGVLIGPAGLDLLALGRAAPLVRGFAEFALTLVLFGDASQVSLRLLRRQYGIPLRLLGVGLPLTILAGALLARPLLPQEGWAQAFVLAVVLAPTDAALGAAVVTDRRLPVSIRQSLNIESGLNDGLCVPLLYTSLAVATATSGGSVAGALRLAAEEIGLGALGGAGAGALAALVVRAGLRRDLIAARWLMTIPAAGAFAAYGVADALGGSGFLAAFVGGLVFGARTREVRAPLLSLLEDGGQVVSALTFLGFGAAALGPALGSIGWRVLLYAVLSLTVVRMLPVAIALTGSGAKPATVAFLGWFGPRGLASIVFAVVVLEGSDLSGSSTIILTVITTVALSVVAHGISARPAATALAHRLAAER